MPIAPATNDPALTKLQTTLELSAAPELRDSLGGLVYMVLPYRVQVSLLIAQVLAAATLLRSIAYDRWVTVVAAVLLIAGTMAAQRGRTWGVVLAFAVGVWFPVAFWIGIAPIWFAVVGLAAAWPFMQLWRSFARFDRAAATTLAAIATGMGIAGAVTYQKIAFPLMKLFPALLPSAYAQNGLAVAATLAVLVAVIASRRKLVRDPEPERARFAEPLRFAELREDRPATADAEPEEEAPPIARARRS